MAAEQNIVEELNITEEQNITEENNIVEERNVTEELNITEELTDQKNYNMSESDPPDQSTMMGQDNGQAESTKRQQNWPMHERCVHGEINEICIPLDRNEVYFRVAQPYQLQPLSRYFFREWSEGAHLFMPAVDLLAPFGYSFPKGG